MLPGKLSIHLRVCACQGADFFGPCCVHCSSLYFLLCELQLVRVRVHSHTGDKKVGVKV